MKFKTTQQKETEVEIPIPSFYKNGDSGATKMVAILDENTVCSVFESELRTNVDNNDITIGKSDIVNAFLNYTPITEQEFLTVYERALTSMSLTPQLIFKPATEDDLKDVLLPLGAEIKDSEGQMGAGC